MKKSFSRKRAFTLIEELAVISIIGVLATIVFYGINSFLSTARDTQRKSDLFAISQGFQARFVDKTCTDPTQVGQYPDSSKINQTDTANNPNESWLPVTESIFTLECNGPTAPYLSRVPSDPQSSQGYGYYFNLSKDGTNFRLAASLEGYSYPSCNTDSSIWINNYGGSAYDCNTDSKSDPDFGLHSRPYNYYIGQ